MKEFSICGVDFKIINEFVNNINLEKVKQKIESRVNSSFFRDLDGIYVGNFKEMKEHSFDSFYSDGCIYLSPKRKTEEEIISDILHELAHHLENIYPNDVYKNDILEKEFLSKRRKLATLLHDDDISRYENLDYDEEFDNFLFREIGYDNLGVITANLFSSPYGATSVREYWATGFEDYFLGEQKSLKRMSPGLFKIITYLNGKINNEY